MTVRTCSTCKHYEPAPIWRKGWCRNPLLYSPQQSHLVGEDDLDCDRGMGNYWEPIDQPGARGMAPGNSGDIRTTGGQPPDESGEIAPIHLQAQRPPNEQQERRGGDVSQYGGPGRPTGSDDYGNSGSGYGGGDDDRYTQPFGDPGGHDPNDGERTPFGYQPEERYWTDYLRIAAPVVGVILMLGLVWFWAANMLSDDNDDEVADDADTAGPVIPSSTPSPTDDAAPDNGTDDAPITVMTPPPGENGEDEQNGEGEPAPTEIGPGATVTVIGTGEAGLNVRASASTGAEVVGSIPDGTALTVTGESQQADGFTWWPIEGDGISGFVAADFVELSQ